MHVHPNSLVGEEIVYVGQVDPNKVKADREIDASGKVVSPGFIDTHAHGRPLVTPDFENFLAMVVAGGGESDRFGMPVDPGNLLFLGRLGGRPVLGLPGCARSPALNGADWVLERVVCGVHVSDADIAAMGVGGLLKEIPTRPQPRERRPRG